MAPGFHKVSQAQLLRADRQAFVRWGELFTGSLKQGTGPGKVLDPYIVQLENDVTVTYFMLPLPISHAKSDPDDKGNKKRSDAALKQTDDTPTLKPPKKTPKREIQFHRASRECTAVHPKVIRYVLGTTWALACSSTDCKRKHVCAVAGCYKLHPQSEHQ